MGKDYSENVFENYNTYDFELNEYQLYYTTIKLLKERSILFFRIKFQEQLEMVKDSEEMEKVLKRVKVNIYNFQKR